MYSRRENFDAQWVDGHSVIPMDKAIEKMTQNRPSHESALEIIADEYDVDVEAIHHGQTTGT